MALKKILMFKNGEWVDYDGSDVKQLIVQETMTLEEIKKHFPKEYEKLKKSITK